MKGKKIPHLIHHPPAVWRYGLAVVSVGLALAVALLVGSWQREEGTGRRTDDSDTKPATNLDREVSVTNH
jgi:hypothetical protein